MKKFVCSVCGYVHMGDTPPAECPVCHVPGSKFVEQKEGEAMKLAGTGDLEEAVRFLARYTPHPVVTLGKGGCAYWEDGAIRYAPAVEEFRAVDTTGAGDNFLAGVIYGLLHDEPLGRCVRLGNIFAGKSTTAVGCFGAAVTPALIREYL